MNHPLEGHKKVKYYLLQRVKAWQQMFFTSALNKWQIKTKPGLLST